MMCTITRSPSTKHHFGSAISRPSIRTRGRGDLEVDDEACDACARNDALICGGLTVRNDSFREVDQRTVWATPSAAPLIPLSRPCLRVAMTTQSTQLDTLASISWTSAARLAALESTNVILDTTINGDSYKCVHSECRKSGRVSGGEGVGFFGACANRVVSDGMSGVSERYHGLGSASEVTGVRVEGEGCDELNGVACRGYR